MSKLKCRLEKIEAKIGETEPIIFELPTGPLVIEGGMRELREILDEVARNGKPLVQCNE